MKLSLTLDGLSSFSRLDTSPLIARLRSEVERELQSTAASGTPPDDAAYRDALAGALRRLDGKP